MSGYVVRLKLFAFRATHILECTSFLQFVDELYQRQLYPRPIVFTTTPPTLPFRTSLGVAGKQFWVSAKVKISNAVAMTTRNARKFEGFARVSKRRFGSKFACPNNLEHIAPDQPRFDVILLGKSYDRAHRLGELE